MRSFISRFLVVIIALVLHRALFAAETKLTFTFLPEDVSLLAAEDGTRVRLREGTMPEDAPGTPWLPARYVTILVPSGAHVQSVDAVGEEVLLRREIDVAPAQPYQVRNQPRAPAVPRDALAYALAGPTPARQATFANENVLRGHSLVTVRLNPLRYVPAAKELYLAPSLTVSVVYDLPRSALRSPLRHAAQVRKLVGGLVVNPDALMSEPDHSLVEGQTAPKGAVDYLIITTEALAASFQPLANHRMQMSGLTARVVSLEEIAATYTGTDHQLKIRNCITDYYSNMGTLYVVLGGDSTVIPDRDCYVSNGEAEPNMPTDLYYSGLDGTWDADGDGVYGETTDNVDLGWEVIVGRIPIQTAAQAAAYINKLVAYETNVPEGLAGKLLLGGMETWDAYTGDDRPSDDVTADGHWGFRDAAHPIVNDAEMWDRRLYRDGIAPYWTPETVGIFCDTLTSWDTSTGGDYMQNAANLRAKFNLGWHHTFFSGHGSQNLWGIESGYFQSSDAAALTNLDVIVYTDACLTGAFDDSSYDPCLSEAFLRNPDGGALVYIGCSRYGWGLSDAPPASNTSDGGPSTVYGYKFYRRLFETNDVSVGMAFAMHKMDMAGSSGVNGAYRWIQFGLNLQGDPAFEMTPQIQDDVQVTPAEGLAVTGYLGGSLSPTHQVYRLANTGESTVMWTAGCASNWVSVTPGNGMLGVGSTTDVSVAINANAEGLGVGLYTVKVVFSNEVSGVVQLRAVSLNVWSTNLTLTLPTSGYEGRVFTNGGRVAISGALATNLTVTLSSSDTSELQVPATVTLLAGQTWIPFDVTLPTDGVTDGIQAGTALTATAAGFGTASGSVETRDRDVHHLGLGAIASPQSAGTPFALTLSALDLNGVTITDYQGMLGLSGAGDFGPVALTPTNVVCVNGVWSGGVRVNTPEANVRLTVSDGQGHSVLSNPFDVQIGPVDHFVWDAIATPQHVDSPFPVRLAARDAGNNTVTSFTGSVTITAVLGMEAMQDDIEGDGGLWSHSGIVDLWHVSTNRCVSPTHAWYCGNDTARVYSNNMNCTLLSPTVALSAGAKLVYQNWYYTESGYDYGRVEITTNNWGTSSSLAVFNGLGNTWRGQTNDLSAFAGRQAQLRFRFSSDVSLTYEGWHIDDIKIITGKQLVVALAPTHTDNFVSGVWTGSVAVLEAATNICLHADDVGGHSGTSGVFTVQAFAGLGITQAASLDTVSAGSNLTYSVCVSNTGPDKATGVIVSDPLPANVSFVSAQISQGTYANVGGTVIWNVGIVSNGFGASATFVVMPFLAGTVSNTVTVTANSTDSNPSDNVARVVTTVTGSGVLTVLPASDFNASGSMGGPFSPASQVYTVTNSGSASLSWVATNTASWVSLSPSGGTLAGRTATTVTASLNASAAALAIGTYSGTLLFTNVTNDSGSTTRAVNLSVQKVQPVTTNTYANSTPLALSDSGAASLYPSTITVAGLSGTVTKVTATLAKLSHTYPDDIDVLLVGPAGQKVMLMSDAGGSYELGNVTLGFDDAAPSSLPDAAQITSGTFRASDYGSGETLPAPAPAGPYGTSLSAFTNLNPNGTWSLYINDDASGDSGSLAEGWQLTINTASENADSLEVIPSEGLSASGPVSGPFTPSERVYTLTNTGVTDLQWEVACPADWVNLAPAAGTLTAGEKETVSVSIGTGASSLVAGDYRTTVCFSNLTDETCFTREVALSVWNTNLVLTLPASGYEATVFANGGGVVAIGGAMTNDLTVTLLSSDTSEVQVPDTVIVPAGQTSVTFNVSLPWDRLTDGVQTGRVTAVATGFSDGNGSVEVRDRDLHHLAISTVPSPQIAGVPFALAFSAQDINGATITIWQMAFTLSGTGDHGPATISPAVAAMTKGVWSGSVRVNALDTNVRLTADDGEGHVVQSNPFDVQVGPVDHFVWSPVESPQRVDVPFAVSVKAQDAGGNTVTAFSGAVALSCAGGAVTNRIMLADLGYDYVSTAQNTRGIRLQPTRDITVTHVRHFWGTKVSIWTDGGVLVASKNVTSVHGTWLETPLDAPVLLTSGTVYRVAGYAAGGSYYYRNGVMPLDFADGVILSGVASSGDVFPSATSTLRYLVDLRYTVGGARPVSISPTNTANFVEGVWSGALSVLEPASNAYLRAADGGEHSGTSGVFTVEALADLKMDLADSPSSGTVGNHLTYWMGVRNDGPSRAGGIRVTDTLPPTVIFVSASAQQGTVTNTGGAVFWDVGAVSNRSSVWAEIVVMPTLGGVLTNSAVLTANVTDPNPNNNSASKVWTVTGRGVLAVTPDRGLSALGFVGGPFTPESQSYTLTNSGTDTIAWQAISPAGWIGLSAAGGTLPARSAATVAVSIGAGARQLPGGTYADTVTFTNLTTADGSTSRAVSLTVLRGGLLGTVWASDNGYAGSMFDIVPKRNLGINAVDVNVSPSGQVATVTVYYREGSSFGRECSSAGWLVLGTRTVMAAGMDLPTFVDLGGNGVEFLKGMTYGLYVAVDYDTGATLRYTKGSGVYETPVLTLISNCGKGDPPFTGGTYPSRIWNGALYYDTELVDALGVSPAAETLAQGAQGGPFAVSGEAYTVANRGEESLTWTAGCSSNWVSVVEGGGVLTAGAWTLATVAVNSNAEALAVGDYRATVAFSNAASGAVLTRDVVLNVWSTELAVTLPASAQEGQVATNGGRVAIGYTLASNLTVRLSASDTNEIRVPPQVTLAAGQTQAVFDVEALADGRADGAKRVTVTASAAGFAPGAAVITVENADIASNEVVGVGFDLATHPGWACEGQWQFGKPTGQGGAVFGNPDPAGGFTGTNVFGVNLRGDYATAVGGPYSLTCGPLDFTGYTNVTVRFRRWLNSDIEPYVRMAVELSTNGTAWSAVWTNGLMGCYESAWRLVEYPLPAADRAPRVFVRWSYQVGPEAFAASGWNLDDIAFSGVPEPVLATVRGTPLAWLQRYGLGENPGWEVADIADADGDGKATWEEYVADTDPTNRDSVLELMGVTFGAGGVEVHWKGGVEATQYVEKKGELSHLNAPWTVFFTNHPPTGFTNGVFDAVGTNRTQFYRVRAVR